LAQTKISTINKFYKEKKPINLQICQVYYNNAKKVLSYADEQMTRAAKNAFQRDNNLNNQGQSLESSCWRRDCLESTPMGKVFGGKCIRWSPEKYMCDVVTYVPKKDSELDLTKNIIQQQVGDDRQNCLKRRDDAPIIFARQLTVGDFLNPALALLGQGLKKSPIGQKLDFANHSYLCKGLYVNISLYLS
jgi:hypothetical protein